jgi:hypothetical protein
MAIVNRQTTIAQTLMTSSDIKSFLICPNRGATLMLYKIFNYSYIFQAFIQVIHLDRQKKAPKATPFPPKDSQGLTSDRQNASSPVGGNI